MALLAALVSGPAHAAEGTAAAGLGIVGLEDGENHSAVFELDYRFAPWRHGIGPAIGVSANSDGGAAFRAGLSRDFPFRERWNANLTLAGGAYVRGKGKDLGKGFEFRSAIELAYEAQPGVRFGATVAHLSNAGISESNPGIETLTLTIAFTPSRMKQQR